MLGLIIAGCGGIEAMMWAVTTVLRLALIIVLTLRLKRM